MLSRWWREIGARTIHYKAYSRGSKDGGSQAREQFGGERNGDGRIWGRLHAGDGICNVSEGMNPEVPGAFYIFLCLHSNGFIKGGIK